MKINYIVTIVTQILEKNFKQIKLYNSRKNFKIEGMKFVDFGNGEIHSLEMFFEV